MKEIKSKQVTITVNRPNGQTEIVDITSKVTGAEKWFAEKMYPRMQAETKKAGRGDIVSYTYQEAEYEKEENDYAGKCEKCGAKIDTRTAYSQKEWTRFCGEKKQVIAYYCNDCHELLGMVGTGEVTALEDRASQVPAQEMINKEEMV